MNAVAFVDTLRARFLERLAANLRGARVPGGDLAAWVAPLPTAALVEVLLHPAGQTREILFAAVGTVRLSGRPVLDQDFMFGALDHVPLSDTAQGALMAWASCRLAREFLDAGMAAEAQRALIAVTRSIHLWPTPIARRFEPRIEALYAAAEAMRARQLAQEVA
ncbi:hypothetical protein MCBMB27_02614 [Methylobacterium phyllosphaerae]|uniref:Uncharacterized protein n=1 Tax=Methylobacterium phyllosphaerae TaxID=418223 RepID=A0AAE8HSJ1_9HYPH|nr:hypothetical protein [Methylobacterium phyllosphaerae]APT31905.1 hypothetical protein MCBMB27_02614 [Methylobacterium phyllosphaerae]SFH01789.1 hypothetical protein SAMN05192567_11253 [Methylobacterium phyllosphaerae]